MPANDQYLHGGDRVAAALKAHSVRFLFTLCGGHISPILTGAKARDIQVVDVRHEATAVFAADAMTRLSGTPGVAVVTAGPGLTNTITALKNAQLSQSALILFGGAAPTALQGRGALQDIDQRPVLKPNVKWLKQVRRVRELVPAVEEAFYESCKDVPSPAMIECPIDVLYDETNVRKWYDDATGKGSSLTAKMVGWYLHQHADSIFSGVSNVQPAKREVKPPFVSNELVTQAREMLELSERPVLIVGSQTLTTDVDALSVATTVAKFGIPTYLSGNARGLLGRNHHLQMRHQRRKALQEADCVILAGVPCDFRLDYGRSISRHAKLIAANRSQTDANLNRKPEIAAIGDVANFLTRLADQVPESRFLKPAWLKQLQERDRIRENEIAVSADKVGQYVNPIFLFREIDRTASDGAIFVADGGDFVATGSYILRPRGPRRWLDPGAFGTLGVGAGFALAASLCHPGEEVWLILGDGASGYSLAEFDTFVRHKMPVIAVVGNDAGWTQIAREQVKILHDDVGTTLARTAYHEVAAGFGAKGILVKQRDDIASALLQAKETAKSGQPVLINVWLENTDFRADSISM